MFDWSDFLDVAEELANRTGDEAALRTAIGRAYYAAFGTARDRLIRSGVRIPQAGAAHAVVWDRFHASPNRAERRIANLGRQLRKRRSWADYDASYPNVASEARKAVRWARQVLTDLAALR